MFRRIGPGRMGERRHRISGVSALALMAPLAVATPGAAVEFSYGKVSGSFDTTLTLGTTIRVQKRDSDLVGQANGGTGNSINSDNGNLNYDRGVVSLAGRATHELRLNYENVGAFTRFTYFYDLVNADESSSRFSRTNRFPLSDDAVERVGRDIDLLDAYVFGSFDVAERPVDVRLGNQVLSWGESTFIQNGINVVNPVDVSALRVPGSEIRDALLPVPVADVNVGLTENLSVEGFYQFAWSQTEPEAANTYFSTSDLASPGGGENGAYLGFGNPLVEDNGQSTTTAVTPFGSRVPRGPDREADDQGQFGFAARYFAPQFNNTEFGAYFVNYHSRLPIISARTGSATDLAGITADNYVAGSQYFLEYPEDIQLLGASFNTTIGGVSLQGEYSFRKDQPLQIDDVELLQAALAPAAVAAQCGGGPGPACSATLGLFNTNQIIRDLGGITTGNFGTFFDRELSGYREFDVSQAQITATQVFGPAIGANQWLLVGEVGVTHVHSMPESGDLRLEGPGTSFGGNANFIGVGGMSEVQRAGFATATSWGYRLRTRFDYLNAIGPVNLYPTVSWSHDVNGTTPLPLGNFLEDRKAISIGVSATYLDAWSADLQYTSFFGGEDFNLIHDRDFVSLAVKYSF